MTEEEPKEKICERCINHIRTKEARNGDFNEIRDYRYCKILDVVDDDLNWMVECEAFEQKKVEDNTIEQAKKSLKKKGQNIEEAIAREKMVKSLNKPKA